MVKPKLLAIIFIIIFLFYLANSLSCDGYEIENCIKCGSGNYSSRCETCEDKYFLALNGEYCINCDHKEWGMAGCAGRCEMVKSINNVNCTDNICKEGFYLVYPGFCATCTFLFDKCKRCTYLPDKNGNNTFKCLECDKGYYLSDDQKCKKCSSSCEKCKKYSKCDKCSDYFYYLANDGKCKKCPQFCKICKNNSTCIQCLEDYYWDPIKKNCIKCPYLSDLKECIKNPEMKLCLKNISYCYICKNGSDSICTSCKSNFYLSSDGKQCKPCRRKKNKEGCIICSDDDKECYRCDDGYYFISKEECGKCSDLFGDKCTFCSISPYDLKPYCQKCLDGYFIGSNGKCKKENATIYSKKDYILVNDDYYILKNSSEAFPYCLKMEVINIDENGKKIYSCYKCENDYIFAINDNRIKSCVNPLNFKELDLCLLSRKENTGDNNYTCLLCEKSSFVVSKYDQNLKKKICKCKNFSETKIRTINDKKCQLCNEIEYCNKCYENANYSIICNGCEEGYTLTYKNKCEPCSISHCLKCDKNINSCEKYQEPYFYSNRHLTDSCYNYIDKCVECEYSALNPTLLECKKCKEDYFLNKNGICEHCYINNKPFCISCTDDENIKKNILAKNVNKIIF